MPGEEPRWVLCDGAAHSSAPDNALRVGLGDGAWHKVTVDIEGLEDRMSGDLPDGLRDLIRIAAFVLAADCATSRGTLAAVDNGASWRRDFRFVVPVAEPDRWNQPALRSALESTIGFLADDHYRFEFVPVAGPAGRGQLRFSPPADGRTFASWNDVGDVQLFSGGMDSFSGALDACAYARKGPLLVSHRASRQMQRVQRELVEALRSRSGGVTPWYLGIDVHRHGRELHHEESQRTRSFLFASIAGAVSWLAGQRCFRFHENGIIALNLPIAAQLQGARGTRTVHPRVLSGFARILKLVTGDPFMVENPYQWFTRADVAQQIRDAGAAELLRMTRSCAAIRAATNMHPSCGVCSQCIDRQFAARGAKMLADDPEEMYAVKAFSDPFERDRDVQLAVGYVGSARVFKALSGRAELVRRYGEVLDASPDLARQWWITEDQALDRIVDLHRKHGELVCNVMDAEVAARATPVLLGRLHPRGLVARCIEGGLAEARRAFGVDDAEGVQRAPRAEDAPPPVQHGFDPVAALKPGAVLVANTFVDCGDGWLVGLKDTRGVIVRASGGMRLLRTLLRSPGHDFPALDLESAAKGVDPASVDGSWPRGTAGANGEGEGATTPGDLPATTPETVVNLRARLDVLKRDEAEAKDVGDQRGADAARSEREEIEDHLGQVLGLDGRIRSVPGSVEKARTKLSKAIDRALKDIEKAGHAGLKRHLKQTVATGYSFSYAPAEPREWVTAP